MRLIWWRRPPVEAPPPLLVREDQRPRFAAAMCQWCARRWLAGRRLLHPGCGEELDHVFDIYFERLRGDE